MMPYERFHAWRACHELAVATYRLTQGFPKSELYGLTSQMRRAAFSAAANIAEGNARFRRVLRPRGTAHDGGYTKLLPERRGGA
ncbi:MAG: four helix bundle protein [Gemmatimonadales bacterium]